MLLLLRGDRVAPNIVLEEASDHPLGVFPGAVVAHDLGVAETNLGLVPPPEVDVVDHVGCEPGDRDGHQDVPLPRVGGRRDGPGDHRQGRVRGRAGDLLDPLRQLPERHWVQRRGSGLFVHPDDEGAAVDREGGKVASELLVTTRA